MRVGTLVTRQIVLPMPSRSLACLLAAIATAANAAKINATLYHINPLTVPASPVNMDLGDLAGDLFFDISQIILVFACSTKHVPPGVICNNKETTGSHLGVTKLNMELDDGFGPYATCNICINGTSPLNKSHTCSGSEYVCDCESATFPPKKLPCDARVGYENTSAFLGSSGVGKFCGFSHGKQPFDASCVTGTAADKLQGSWYSTLKQGVGKTWRMHDVVKRVRRDCHSDSFYSAVEATLPSCFSTCPRAPGSARNHSSLCWAGCFSDAALGPQARNSTSHTDKGMSAAELMAAWSRPFESADPKKGGCPAV